MSRSLLEQFVTFWFVLGERDPATDAGSEAAFDEGYPTWKAAVELLEKRHTQVPGYQQPFTEGTFSYEVERWEFCGQSPEVEHVDGKLCWPVAFYSTNAFVPEHIKALQDLSIECANEASKSLANGTSVRFIKTEVQSVYRDTETVTLGLQ